MDGIVVGDPAIAALIRSALDDYYNDEETLDKEKLQRFLADAKSLRDHGSAAVTAVIGLFSNEGTRDRVVAAELVGRMSHDAGRVMHDLCWSRLEAMLAAAEQAGRDSAAGIAGIAAAFQHLEDARTLPALLALAAHPCGDVRLAVASSIPMACKFAARDDAVDCLAELTGDSEADVRNWACFGLGQLDADGREVREALAARLNDEHTDTRCEALLALARTGDTRAPQAHRAHRAIEARLRTELGEHLVGSGRTVRLQGEFPRTRLIIRANDGQTELLNGRTWDNTNPLDFNFEQECTSYLLTAGTTR